MNNNNNNNNKLEINKNYNKIKKNFLQKISDNLNKIKLEKDSIYNKYLIEKNNLIIKYQQKYKEIYDKINSLILNENFNYWYKILINCNFFDMTINDRKILIFLYLIEFIPDENSLNFSVKFYFKENDFFEPKILEKKYFFDFKGNFLKTNSTKIQWKNEKFNPTIEIQKKEIVNNLNTFKKTFIKKINSFFNIFDNFEMGKNNKNISTIENEENSESENNFDYEEIVFNLKEEINFFKNDFFKNQLEYYLNIMEIHFIGEIEDDKSSSSNENNYEINNNNLYKKIKRKNKRKNKRKKIKKNKNNNFNDECQNQ